MAVTARKLPAVDDRAELAAALEAAAEAKSALHNHRNAIDKTRAAQRNAERALETARKGIGLAREQHVQALAAAVADDDLLPTSSVRLAKLSVADAEEEIANLKDALLQLKSRTADYEYAAKVADADVTAAAAGVLVAPEQALLAQARQAWAVLEPLKRALEQAVTYQRTPSGTWQDITAAARAARPLEPLHAEIDQFLVECSRLGDGRVEPNPFKAAMLALEQDAYAEIELPGA